jgi:hypothetical protein
MTSVADLGNNERRYSVSLSSCLARAHYQTRQGWLFAARAPQRCGRHHDRDRSIKGRSQRRKRRPPSEGRLTPAYTLGSHANPIERRPAGRVRVCAFGHAADYVPAISETRSSARQAKKKPRTEGSGAGREELRTEASSCAATAARYGRFAQGCHTLRSTLLRSTPPPGFPTARAYSW